MNRRTLVGLVALALALALGPAPALAQQKTVIKLGWITSDGPQDPYAIGARAFKQALEKTAGGQIEVQLYPNRQLGDEKALVEGMRFGTLDAGIITNALVAPVEQAYQLNDLPFLFASEQQAQKVLDGPVGQKLARKLEAKGIVSLACMEGGFRHMINNVRPVTRPEDIKGVKYRVMQNPVYIDMFTALGGSAIPMAWGETFTAVQQGTIDGLEIPVAVIDANKYFEVTKYLSITNHTYSVIHLLMSKRTFDKLSPDLQKAVREAAATATAEQRKASGTNARELLANLQAKGMKVNPIADPAAFRATVKGIYEKYRATIGPELMDEALAAVK
ncbi:MAG: TRAP transporter substrate-binding protein [Deltaproteobacteria bacterium]|nr:TRAP transporter substrate-binding protein [Deltaproteobacteria bacterium]